MPLIRNDRTRFRLAGRPVLRPDDPPHHQPVSNQPTEGLTIPRLAELSLELPKLEILQSLRLSTLATSTLSSKGPDHRFLAGRIGPLPGRTGEQHLHRRIDRF